MFGNEEETKVIYYKINQNNEMFELLREINHILISTMLENKVLERHELSHARFNKES